MGGFGGFGWFCAQFAPDDLAGWLLGEAREILELAAEWRPLPDLTILITDDPATAISRAERRDNRTVAGEEPRHPPGASGCACGVNAAGGPPQHYALRL